MSNGLAQLGVHGVTTQLDPAAVQSVAEAFLLLLRSRGINNFYINSGTDFAPLVEGYTRLVEQASPALPRLIVGAHENLSMGMAHGAYLMSGEPQAVMFHVSVGTANAVCAAMNAAAERVPLLICAGRSPLYEIGKVGSRNTRVAWAQEMFDQSGLLREAIKWEYELRGSANVDAVVERSLTMAMTEPRGPVYLTLPREVLAEPPPTAKPPVGSPVNVPTAPAPDPAAIEVLADRLANARMPVMSSLASGAEPASVKLLAELCETYAIGYVEEQARYLNCPSDHPLHLGYRLAPLLGAADVWCFVESDVPWIQEYGEPRADAFIVQCGVDPDFSRYPIRTHRRDLAITAGPTALFRALHHALDRRRHQIDPDRHGRIAQVSAATRRKYSTAKAVEINKGGAISYDFLSATLGDVLHDGCTLFSEYWVTREYVGPTQPKSYFYLPATGGLGWALPAALGAKVEAPDRTMVAAVGDGTYMFSNPAACHHASQKHGLAVLTVICNNSRWNAVDLTAMMVYPTGFLATRKTSAFSDLSPAPAFEEYVKASGGYGEVVTQRADLRDALLRGINVVEREGRQAVINVICD